MKFGTRLVLLVPLLAGAALSACASEKPLAPPPESSEAPAPSRDDGRARLVRGLDALKQPGDRAEKDTDTARSVLEAIGGGSTEMQADAGRTDH